MQDLASPTVEFRMPHMLLVHLIELKNDSKILSGINGNSILCSDLEDKVDRNRMTSSYGQL